MSGMTDHPLTETDAEITDKMVEAGASYAWEKANPGARDWDSLSASHKEGCRRDARAVLTAALAVAPTAAAARPWEPLNGRTPRLGDEVRRDYCGTIRTGVVGRMNGIGEVWTAEGGYIGDLRDGTWYVRRAPAPPAEEVELPSEHPAHLIGVEGMDGAVCAHMALDRLGLWIGVSEAGECRCWGHGYFAAFTLPDGTRARRDGDHANGEPRFVKDQEEES